MDLEHVAKQVKKGRLVSVTFLSERGREENEIPDHPCADARAAGERFAFFHAFASCAHAIEVDRVEEVGDEVFLHGRTGEARLRLRVSPVWLDEQREVLAAWAREKDAAFVGRELSRVLA
jgi:hypothetical protein